MKNKEKISVNKFREAVEATPDITICFQNGLAGLGQYRNRVSVSDTRLLNGSIDIDSCTTGKYPNDFRWDYAISYNSEVFFIEVHSAQTSEVSRVLNKLKWLKNWLNEHAPEINKLKTKSKFPFYWIQSKNFQIAKNTPQYRKARTAGLLPIAKLVLS